MDNLRINNADIRITSIGVQSSSEASTESQRRITQKSDQKSYSVGNNVKENDLSETKVVAAKNVEKKECKYDNALSKLTGIATEFYNASLPAYEDIEIILENKKIKWINLSIEKQLQLLAEGARGKEKEIIQNFTKNLNESKESKSTEETDAFIEKMVGTRYRMYHDCRHALRAYSLIRPIADFYKNTFSTFGNLTEKDVFLAQVCALFHDSGRQADGVDIFDSLSATQAKEALIKCQIELEVIYDEKDIDRVFQCIKNKDVASSQDKDIIAVLLHEADCMEYNRICDGSEFEKKYLDVYGGKDDIIFESKTGVNKDDLVCKINMLIQLSNELIFKSKEISDGKKDMYDSLAGTLRLTDINDLLDELIEKERIRKNQTVCLHEFKSQMNEGFALNDKLSSNELYTLFDCDDIYAVSDKIIKEYDNLKNNLKDDFVAKLDKAKEIASFCKALESDGFTSEFARKVSYFRLKMLSDDIFTKDNNKYFNKINTSDVRGVNGITSRFRDFCAKHGGSFELIEILGLSQHASSNSFFSVCAKTWFKYQLNAKNNIGSYFASDKSDSNDLSTGDKARYDFQQAQSFGGETGRNKLLKSLQQTKLEQFQKLYSDIGALQFNAREMFLKSYPKEKYPDLEIGAETETSTSVFDNTLYMWYAFNQELLPRLQIPVITYSQDGYEILNLKSLVALIQEDAVDVFRAIDYAEYSKCCQQNINNNGTQEPGNVIQEEEKGIIISSAVYSSTSSRRSAINKNWEYASHVLKLRIPVHRVFFTEYPNGFLDNNSCKTILGDDSEHEFVCMCQGISYEVAQKDDNMLNCEATSICDICANILNNYKDILKGYRDSSVLIDTLLGSNNINMCAISIAKLIKVISTVSSLAEKVGDKKDKMITSIINKINDNINKIKDEDLAWMISGLNSLGGLQQLVRNSTLCDNINSIFTQKVQKTSDINSITIQGLFVLSNFELLKKAISGSNAEDISKDIKPLNIERISSNSSHFIPLQCCTEIINYFGGKLSDEQKKSILDSSNDILDGHEVFNLKMISDFIDACVGNEMFKDPDSRYNLIEKIALMFFQSIIVHGPYNQYSKEIDNQFQPLIKLIIKIPDNKDIVVKLNEKLKEIKQELEKLLNLNENEKKLLELFSSIMEKMQ